MWAYPKTKKTNQKNKIKNPNIKIQTQAMVSQVKAYFVLIWNGGMSKVCLHRLWVWLIFDVDNLVIRKSIGDDVFQRF